MENNMENNMGNNKTNFWWYFTKVAILIGIIEVFYFRNVIFSHGLLGDFIDARLNNIFIEHWYRYVLGLDSLTEARFFAPISNAIFHSDLLCGLAPFYCVLRFLGCNMFVANKIVLIGLHYFGSVSFFLILNYIFRIPKWISLVGLAIASYGCAYSLRINYSHTQMMVISVVPLFYLSFIGYLNLLINSNNDNCNSKDQVPVNKKSPKSVRLLLGTLSLFVLIFMLYTSFYVFFFTVLFTLITILVLGVMLFCLGKKNKINSITTLKLKKLKQYWLELGAFIFAALLLMAPLAVGYLSAFGYLRRVWVEAAHRLPRFVDIINVSGLNLFYGDVIKLLKLDTVSNFAELHIGLPFFTLILAIFSIYYVFTKSFKNNFNLLATQKDNRQLNKDVNLEASQLPYYLFVSCTISIVISAILLVRWDNYSLWWLIYSYFPGGSAIRMVARYAIFLYWPLSFVICMVLSSVFNLKSNDNNQNNNQKIIKQVLALLCFVLIFFENQITGGLNGHWDSSSQEDFISKVTPPPGNCQYFFVCNSPNRQKQLSCDKWQKLTDDQLNAALIANKYNIHTLNGYSGGDPAKWYLKDVQSPGYIAHVMSWVQGNNLDTKSIYCYDLTNRTWTLYSLWTYGVQAFDYDSDKLQTQGKCLLFDPLLNLPGAIVLEPQSSITGPHVNLEKGQYNIVITGRNIDKNSYAGYSWVNKQVTGIDVSVITKEPELVILSLTVDKKAENFGVRICNKGFTASIFYNMYIREIRTENR